MNTLNEYVISDKYKIVIKSSLEGVQYKYFKDGYWYKIDGSCHQGLTEKLVSILLENSTLPKDSFVSYEWCRINGKYGCRSKNFFGENESFITFEELYRRVKLRGSLKDDLWAIREAEDRYLFLIDIAKEITDLDVSDYLKRMIYLDMLVLNRDRHTHNYGFIYNSITNKFRCAPIFDNGLSLRTGMSIEDSVNSVMISGSFEQQAIATGYPLSSPFKVDYDKVYDELWEYPYAERNVLIEKMKKYESIFRL